LISASFIGNRREVLSPNNIGLRSFFAPNLCKPDVANTSRTLRQ